MDPIEWTEEHNDPDEVLPALCDQPSPAPMPVDCPIVAQWGDL